MGQNFVVRCFVSEKIEFEYLSFTTIKTTSNETYSANFLQNEAVNETFLFYLLLNIKDTLLLIVLSRHVYN